MFGRLRAPRAEFGTVFQVRIDFAVWFSVMKRATDSWNGNVTGEVPLGRGTHWTCPWSCRQNSGNPCGSLELDLRAARSNVIVFA